MAHTVWVVWTEIRPQILVANIGAPTHDSQWRPRNSAVWIDQVYFIFFKFRGNIFWWFQKKLNNARKLPKMAKKSPILQYLDSSR